MTIPFCTALSGSSGGGGRNMVSTVRRGMHEYGDGDIYHRPYRIISYAVLTRAASRQCLVPVAKAKCRKLSR